MKKKIKFMLMVISASFLVVFSQKAQAQDADDDILEMSLEDLMNIQVTVASKSEEKISDAPGVISVVTKEELARFGGISLKDILERVPSLTTLSGSWTDRNALASRGDMVKSTSSHVLILIDGRPTREIVEGGIVSEMMGAFPVNIIERIEVIRGPGSVLYGNMAMSAVINIVTIPAKRNNVVYSEIFGENGATGRTAQAQFVKGDFNATVGGRMLKKAPQEVSATVINSDIFGQPTDTVQQSTNAPDQALSAFAKMQYKGLSLTTSLQKYEAIYYTQGVFDVNTWMKNFYNVGYDFNITENWKSSVNGTYNYSTMETNGTPFTRRESNDVVAEWTNYISIADNINLIAGGLYNHVEGREYITQGNDFIATGTEISTGSRNSFVFYSQIDWWAVDDKLKLIGGFQGNKVDALDIDLVPRLGAIWYATPRLNVKALYGEAYRTGTINETGIDYLGFFVGNPDILPEKTKNFDLGVNYQGSKGMVGINYFHTVHTNSIIQGPRQIDTLSVLSYINAAEYSFDGLELETKYYLTNELYFIGSALYQNLTSDDEAPVRTPVSDFSFKAGLSYQSQSGLTLSLFNIYNASLNRTSYPAGEFNPDAASSTNVMNLYINLDMVKMFSIDTDKKLSVFVQQENILDEKVWGPEGSGISSPYNRGRSIYFGLTFGL